ncbi:MAG: hypothetical protein GFH27_549307n107 [Chloroflexi bacterium AL-W]|nr:hypothetical protein [Chloroflexi bacterium AL-N1]NOK69139.1 hypothetical protein [Chloroflexi bacterium AL-N10]NOK77122.1 hypothetical protein [Chloroflexi bacterium AL-N5]NOK83767.1 hypothetical protein [Chloroflexi bacterium AL-W]NOK90977.1 hypothetical protein [Chloroflexi bacterium AL-N15]
MSTELTIGISVIVTLLLIPLFTIVLVRILIPLKVDGATFDGEEEDAPLEFSSLRDFWDSNVPHLRELRNRLFIVLLSVGLGTVVGVSLMYGGHLIFGEQLPVLIAQHFSPGVQLQGIDVAEIFVSFMRIGLVFGITVSVPIILYQVVAFLAPALHPREKRALFIALPFVFELFLAGLAFGWFITVPAAIQFLVSFGTSESLQSNPRIDNYFSTIAILLLWNGLIFELPAIVYVLARVGLVTAKMLASTRRYAIVAVVIVAAIITPTGDPFNLLLLALPMYILYELGIFLARFVPKRDYEDD